METPLGDFAIVKEYGREEMAWCDVEVCLMKPFPRKGESRNFTTGENISFPLPLSYFSSDNFPSLVELDEDEKRTVPHLVAICPADVQLPFQNPKVSREGRESLLFLIILMRPCTESETS
ncbi:hypothetical protein RUM43_002876 [Polyplax serrata]|uniref:Uncharacterized protein n=1 Tax=Polyplax serrata TaxID=468196 RepID=A0AAN8NZC9_POLSC